MHDTAAETGKVFFETYGKPGMRILDVGSMDVNGTLRPWAPAGCEYIGLDTMAGPGVDWVCDIGQIDTESFDIIVSSSCLEHDPMFWATFLNMCRIVRPSGLIYVNAPANGPVHRHPIDCWRFYPDAGHALAEWANRSGQRMVLLECWHMPPQRDVWIDFVAVWGKQSVMPPPPMVDRFPQAIRS